ncbi:MAG TPA: hypothetical protein VFA20_08465 [Myxococcaceae bacterium]|nr:hypothetical protein [Myxococcaceae bacterium]
MKKRARGHVLVEAMASAAILFWAMSGLVAGLVAGSKLLGTASADRAATDLVSGEVERLRALPTSDPAWAVGAVDAGVVGHPSWTFIRVVTNDLDTDAGSVPLTYRHAVVVVTYGASTYSEEAFK